MQIGEMTSHSLLLNGSTAFFHVVLLNICFFLCFMLARYKELLCPYGAALSLYSRLSLFFSSLFPSVSFLCLFIPGNTKVSAVVAAGISIHREPRQ